MKQKNELFPPRTNCLKIHRLNSFFFFVILFFSFSLLNFNSSIDIFKAFGSFPIKYDYEYSITCTEFGWWRNFSNIVNPLKNDFSKSNVIHEIYLRRANKSAELSCCCCQRAFACEKSYVDLFSIHLFWHTSNESGWYLPEMKEKEKIHNINLVIFENDVQICWMLSLTMKESASLFLICVFG